MADEKFLVDTIATVEESVPTEFLPSARQQAGKRLVAIRFSSGSIGTIDTAAAPGAIWMSVLRHLHELARPAYVEIDPATHFITNVLQPQLQPIGAIEPEGDNGDFRVELMRSHALHFLRRKHPRYTAVLHLLRDAQRKDPVWVTETLNTHEIIDVRPQTAAAKSGD